MSAGHFTYLSPLISDDNLQKFVTALAVGAGLYLVGSNAASILRSNKKERIVPLERAGVFGVFDVLLEGLLNLFDSILGKHNRRYFPLCASLFLFIFVSNLIGLVPGMPALTTSVWITVGMSLVVFCAFNAYGIKEHGLWGYLKHFLGPVAFLAPLILVIEVVSTLLRILTLNLRLFWNITADHIVLDVFSGLAPVVPIIFYGLGTFVCFMQAFVFTILTMVYILLATQHEEGHEAHHH